MKQWTREITEDDFGIKAGQKGKKGHLVPGIMDQITALFMQFRHKQCLDCMIPEIGRGETGEQRPQFAVCNDPICTTCYEIIEKI